jgi:DNA invertase Pin-like site-specific DNA recombinase
MSKRKSNQNINIIDDKFVQFFGDMKFDDKNMETELKKRFSNYINNTNSNNENSAIIFVRSSTNQQEDSCSTQIEKCKQYCVKNNLVVKQTDIYKFDGHSAYKEAVYKLPILEIIAKPENANKHLVFNDPSRLSRNVQFAFDILHDCEKQNIKLHSVREELVFDLKDKKQKIELLVSIEDAQKESELISKRIMESNDIQRDNGGHFGKVPFGKEKYIEHKETIPGNIINVRKIRNLPEEHVETRVIKVIKILRGSCVNITVKEFLNLFNGLHAHKVQYGSEEEPFCNLITWVNFVDKDLDTPSGYSDIAQLLNDWDILNRGKKWNVASIMNLVIQNNLNKPIEKPKQYYNNYNNYINCTNSDDDDYDYK